MSLVAGTRLGPYEIQSAIGAGGMGEVYKARDTRLDRTVAIKVLPAELSADPDRRTRFEREARAVAALSHPHICTLYDIGEAVLPNPESRIPNPVPVHYLVMEYLAGESLADRLVKGPLPLAQALELAVQIAEALDAAHKHGIIHRDLKPGNVMLTVGGSGRSGALSAKLLDFGLAKLVAHGERPALLDDATAPTQAAPVTMRGTILGTLQYMAPEQLEGKEADARTDLWALGATLYEMVTGKRAFEGGSQISLIAQIMNAEPAPLEPLQPLAPPALERVVKKCLAKHPDDRWDSAHDVADELRWIRESVTGAPGDGASRKRSRLGVAGAAVAGAAVVGLAVAWLLLGPWPWSTETALAFAPRDWILLADVQNDTGNALFDRSLTTALRISLEQSSHANVLPRARVAATLRRMGKTGFERVDEDIGREICLRENARGLVAPSLSRVASEYLLSAQLVDPATGERVRSYAKRVESEKGLLDAVDTVARDVRRDLGESLATIQQSSRPLPKVTTPSLQALKLYADGSALWGKGDYDTAVSQYAAAVAGDPEFAMAHAALGSAYMSFIYNDRVKGRQHLERAIELADRTTERERLTIQITHASSLDTPAQAERLYRLYLSQYPDDAPMRYNFGSTLMRQERFREAIDELSEVVRVVPTFASAYVNLATCQASERLHEQAIANYDKAFAIEPAWKVGGNLNHEYGFAFVQAGDHAKAREVFSLAAGRPAEKARALRAMALLDVFEGRHRRAAETFREAALTNEAAKNGVSAARDRLLLAATLGSIGDKRGSLRELEAASRLLEGGSPQVWLLARVGQAFARASAVRRAEQMLVSAKAHVEENNAAQAADVQVLEGEIELARGRVARAIEHFDRAYRAKPGPLTIEPLARGAAAAGDDDRSVEHYRALMGLGHRCTGWEAQAPWLAAHYEFARLLAERGDRDLARTTVDELLTLWKESDGSPSLLEPARALRASLD